MSSKKPYLKFVNRLIVIAFLAALSGCGDASSPTSPGPELAGTYTATTFVVVVPGHESFDVLAGGGGLSITIARDFTTSGTLTAPSSITGSPAPTRSMAGSASLRGATVTFSQSEDTFVQHLEWILSGKTLSVANAPAGPGFFTVTLT